MNNALIIGLGIAAYLYLSNNGGSPPTAAAPATGTVPAGIAIGEHNPSVGGAAGITYGGGGGETEYGGGWASHGGAWFGGGPPRQYEWNYGPGNPFDDPWFNTPSYSEQYPMPPGVIHV